jgi:acetyl-CoA acyltransferase 2
MAASAHLARKGLFIVGAKRTPFGAFGGKLKGFSATELAYLASKAALVQAKVDPKVRCVGVGGACLSVCLSHKLSARSFGCVCGALRPCACVPLAALCLWRS